MKNLLCLLLVISMLVLSACSNSNDNNSDYVTEIVGEWHLVNDYGNGVTVVKEYYIFNDDNTGEYSNEYSWDIPDKPQHYDFTWSYDEDANVYLIYGQGSNPKFIRIAEIGGKLTMTCGPSTGTKIK